MVIILIAAIAIVAVVAFYCGKATGQKDIITQLETYSILKYRVGISIPERLREEVISEIEKELIKNNHIEYHHEDGVFAAKLKISVWKRK